MRGRRLGPRILVAFGLLCLIVATLEALLPDADEPPGRLIAVGSFGLAVLAGAALEGRSHSAARAARSGSVRVHGAVVPALEIPFSAGKLWLAVMASLGFVGTGVGIYLSGGTVLGVITIATFGLFALLGAYNIATGSRVALSERGVHVRGAGSDVWVPWDEVTDVGTSRVSSAPFISVDSANGARAAGPWWSRALARMNSHWSDVSIPIDTLAVDPEALERTIRQLADDPAARPGIATRVHELDPVDERVGPAA